MGDEDTVIIELEKSVRKLTIVLRQKKDDDSDDEGSRKSKESKDSQYGKRPTFKQCRARASTTGRRCRKSTEHGWNATSINQTGRCAQHANKANEFPA